MTRTAIPNFDPDGPLAAILRKAPAEASDLHLRALEPRAWARTGGLLADLALPASDVDRAIAEIRAATDTREFYATLGHRRFRIHANIEACALRLLPESDRISAG